MSLQIRDTITPDLRRKIAALQNRRPVLQAMGAQLVSITVRAFRDSALRAMPWPPKRDGKSATLYKTGALKHSIRVVEVTNDSVTVGSDRPYAAIHQVGGRTKPHEILAKYRNALAWPGGAHPVKRVNHPGSNIPARPFFPFKPDGTPTSQAVVDAVGRKAAEILKRQAGIG
jgi:phage gpG-like protein